MMTTDAVVNNGARSESSTLFTDAVNTRWHEIQLKGD